MKKTHYQVDRGLVEAHSIRVGARVRAGVSVRNRNRVRVRIRIRVWPDFCIIWWQTSHVRDSEIVL